MSRKGSHQVNCAKAIAQNKSPQLKARTPASPPWRSMMRPNVFYCTYFMICAKIVLPTFMHRLRLYKPESIANVQIEIHIVDALETLEARIAIILQAFGYQINRTLQMNFLNLVKTYAY